MEGNSSSRFPVVIVFVLFEKFSSMFYDHIANVGLFLTPTEKKQYARTHTFFVIEMSEKQPRKLRAMMSDE